MLKRTWICLCREKNSSFNMIWNCIPLYRNLRETRLTDKNQYLIQSRTKGTLLTQVASCCNSLSHHVYWMKQEDFVKHCFHLRSRGAPRCAERWFSVSFTRKHHCADITTGTVAITWDFFLLSTSPFMMRTLLRKFDTQLSERKQTSALIKGTDTVSSEG